MTNRINLTQKGLELTDQQEELLLYIDNTGYQYKKLQEINKNKILENRYYNTWFLETNKDKIKTAVIDYLQFLRRAIDDYNRELDPDIDIVIGQKELQNFAKYLYLREAEKIRFDFNTGLDATKKQIEIIGELFD
jgi:hypothetical protein